MRQEADINRLFRHENVIQMFDYFMDKGQMYIVLEYCSNNSLKELLNRRTTITEPECRYYIRQVGRRHEFLFQNTSVLDLLDILI